MSRQRKATSSADILIGLRGFACGLGKLSGTAVTKVVPVPGFRGRAGIFGVWLWVVMCFAKFATCPVAARWAFMLLPFGCGCVSIFSRGWIFNRVDPESLRRRRRPELKPLVVQRNPMVLNILGHTTGISLHNEIEDYAGGASFISRRDSMPPNQPFKKRQKPKHEHGNHPSPAPKTGDLSKLKSVPVETPSAGKPESQVRELVPPVPVPAHESKSTLRAREASIRRVVRRLLTPQELRRQLQAIRKIAGEVAARRKKRDGRKGTQ